MQIRNFKIKLFGILIIIIIVALKFIDQNTLHYTKITPQKEYSVLQDYADDSELIPRYGKSFIGFKEKLAFKESQGKYHAVNTLGYMGKYQFGASTLASLKVHDTLAFLKSPKIQEKTFYKYLAQNKKLLAYEINTYSGKRIKGVEITESGILAAAHLAGVGNVKKFLRSWGRNGIKDAYGTRIEYYLKDFAHYDLSVLDQQQKA